MSVFNQSFSAHNACVEIPASSVIRVSLGHVCRTSAAVEAAPSSVSLPARIPTFHARYSRTRRVVSRHFQF